MRVISAPVSADRRAGTDQMDHAKVNEHVTRDNLTISNVQVKTNYGT